MANAVKGVIAGAKGAPVSVETILVPDPGPGEALVRIQACGVCHTDLHYREGAITNDFPFCSVMKRPVLWRKSGRMLPMWHLAILSSWPGGRRAGRAGPVCGGGHGTVLPVAMPSRR